jgi:hypothetical protein
MNQPLYLLTKAILSGAVIVAASELAKRNNTLASIVHSLPLMSLVAFLWLFAETRDTALIGRHAFGTFWFVLPTLPLFLLLPVLFKRGWHFWPALAVGIVVTVLLYALTLRLLKSAGIQL